MKNIVISLLFCCGLDASASVDETGITLSHSGSGQNQYFLEVGVGRPGFLSGGWFLDFDPAFPARLVFTNTVLDPGVDLYSINGLPIERNFGSTTIPSSDFTKIAGWDGSGYVMESYVIPKNQVSGCSKCFYVGVNTGFLSGGPNTFSQFGFDRSVFGWAEFEYSASGLQLMRSALTYDSSGIYIGTQNTVPIPEPQTSALMLAGLAALAHLARRRSKHQ